MKSRVFLRVAGLAAIIGGFIWIFKGAALAVLPSGNPGRQQYRSSQSFMPWFGCGLACIGIAMAGLYRTTPVKTAFQRWSLRLAVLGSFLYCLGTLSRMSMNLSVQWEPVQPIGLLLAIVGMLLSSISVLRARVLPYWCRVLMLLGSLCLLIFNDQFITAWSSVPFGAVWIALGIYLAGAPLPEKQGVDRRSGMGSFL